MVDGGEARATAERRLAELKAEGQSRAKPQARRPRAAPEEPIELECQLTNLQAMADGNWVVRLVAPYRASDDVTRCNALYGWRLRCVLDVHPAEWE